MGIMYAIKILDALEPKNEFTIAHINIYGTRFGIELQAFIPLTIVLLVLNGCAMIVIMAMSIPTHGEQEETADI